jgi:RNA-binding protein
MAVTKEEKKALKGLSHHLKPVAIAGKEGMSETFIKSVEDVIASRELVKIKFSESSGLDRKVDSKKLAEILKAEVIDVIGFSVTLYRYNENAKKHALVVEVEDEE